MLALEERGGESDVGLELAGSLAARALGVAARPERRALGARLEREGDAPGRRVAQRGRGAAREVARAIAIPLAERDLGEEERRLGRVVTGEEVRGLGELVPSHPEARGLEPHAPVVARDREGRLEVPRDRARPDRAVRVAVRAGELGASFLRDPRDPPLEGRLVTGVELVAPGGEVAVVEAPEGTEKVAPARHELGVAPRERVALARSEAPGALELGSVFPTLGAQEERVEEPRLDVRPGAGPESRKVDHGVGVVARDGVEAQAHEERRELELGAVEPRARLEVVVGAALVGIDVPRGRRNVQGPEDVHDPDLDPDAARGRVSGSELDGQVGARVRPGSPLVRRRERIGAGALGVEPRDDLGGPVGVGVEPREEDERLLERGVAERALDDRLCIVHAELGQVGAREPSRGTARVETVGSLEALARFVGLPGPEERDRPEERGLAPGPDGEGGVRGHFLREVARPVEMVRAESGAHGVESLRRRRRGRGGRGRNGR